LNIAANAPWRHIACITPGMKITRCFPRLREIAVHFVSVTLIGTAVAGAVVLAAAPAAHAQVVTVSLTKEALPDSRIPSKTVWLPLPRCEPSKLLEDHPKRLFFALSVRVYAESALDMQESESLRPHFRECAPLGQPVVGPARAGLLRRGCPVRDGRELARVENGAHAWLAQSLVSSASGFDGGGPGGTLFHSRAVDLAPIKETRRA
jgi:hypothetical protein